jgi:hypothetical protein
VAVEAWGPLGVVDPDNCLTDFGAAVLPAALVRAWQPI